MGISCRVSFKNNALEVVDKNGQPSKLYYDALALTGNEDKAIDLWYKAFSQEFTEQVRLNKDDVTLDEVLKFVSANSSFGKSLEPAEIRSIKDIMDKNSFETLSDLYRTLVDIFKPQGIIELDTVKAYQSGLFDLQGLSEINLNEIDDILDKVEGTLRVTDIYVAPSSDSSASFIDTSRKTILGTPEFISQEDIEQKIVNNVENTKDEKEISSYINSLPYSSFADRFNKEGSFRTTILNNISKYTKVNTLFIVDGRPTTKNLNYYKSLVNTIGSNNNTEGLIADFEFLSGIDEDVWSQNQDEIKEVLREIEQDQFTENGIDIFGLSKFSSNKFLVIDTLNSLGEMLNNTTNETILNFSEKFIKVVPQPVSTTSELLPESLEPYAENIFRVDSALNDSELFRQFGLLKVSDNIYHKVDLGSRSNLYEELYQQAKETGYPISINTEDKEVSLRDLEQYVLLQDSNVEKDIREEYNLNKIIFNHPKIQDTNDYLQLSDITTDTEYLVRDFARDFNDYIVTEKQVDSQLYRDTLSKFRVSDSGVSLAVPIKSIEGLEFEKELTDYIRLKKDQSMKYLLPSRPTNLKSRVDLQAINNPASVLNYSRQYAFDNGLLVTEKVSDNYVNFFGNTYAKVAEDSTNSVFKVVPKNLDANYYVTNTDFITSEDKENATQVLNDAKFSFTNSTLSEQEFDKSIEDAGIKNKVKFSIFGPKGAARLDAKEESSRRIDNLKTAIEMLGGKTFDQLYPKQKKAIKLATEWELGVDNKWKYESITDSKATLNLGINSIEDLDKKKKLSEVLDYPELFDAYPQIKNLKISVSEKGGSTGEATFSPSKNEIIIGVSKYKLENHFKEKENLVEISYLREEVFEALKFMAEKALRIGLLEKSGMSFIDALDKVSVQFTFEEEDKHSEILSETFLVGDIFYELLNTLMDGLSGEIQESEFDDFDAKTLTSVLHEIQHWIQQKEGFARGGNAYIALRLATPEQKEELDLALAEVRKLQGSGIDFSNASPQEMKILLKPFDLEDTLYRSVAGEVEARNVEERLGLFDEARKGTLLEDTADMFPFRQKVYYSSLDLINTQYGEPLIDTAIEKLKQTGLASRVNLMSPDEIYERLTSLGVNLNSKKQISDKNLINKDELAQDYFTREADRLPLTLAVFNRPEFVKMQGKSVNKIAVLNSLNQSGIKQIEKDLVRSVIEDFYKDQPKVSYDELEATVRANIMPLEVLNTNLYDNYGMDNLSNGDYGDANTIIFNSPIEHGITGNHFKSSFNSKSREKLNYVPKQLNNNTWVAVQEGYENQANGNDIYQYVGTAGTQEDVDEWISNYKNPNKLLSIDDKSLVIEVSEVSQSTKEQFPDSDIVDVQLIRNGEVLKTSRRMLRNSEESMRASIIDDYNIERGSLSEATVNKGMFGHIRVWTDGDIYHVAELQSDYFQKYNARKNALDRNTEYAEAFADKSDTLKKLKEKREASLISLRDSGYVTAYDRGGVKSKIEVFKALNIFGEELGKREKVEVVKIDDHYAISVDGKVYDRTFFSTKELAEEQIKEASKKLDFDTTEKNNQPLTENDIPEELKGAFNFVIKDFYTEEKSIEKEFSNTVESIVAKLPLAEKQFIASQKEWEKRMVREALRLASSSGASKLRLPTPHTLSVIEGYISGDGAPYDIITADDYNRLVPGDKIDYLGSSQTVISADRDSIEIVLTEDVLKSDIEDYINDELNHFTNEVVNYESGLDFETQYTEEEFNDADKHSSLDGVDLEDIAEKVEDGLYEISRDKLEQVVRDYFSIFYNEDNIDSVLSDQGYSNINVNGKFVYFTTRDIDTETLSQPDEYSDSDKDTFSISDLSDTDQTVANKYVELAEILRKEVGEENVETVTDDQGYDWYETDVEDKYSNKAVIAFQKQLSEQGIKPIVNGFVYNNEVFLNKDTVTEETPIHEFNHLFTDWMKKNRPSLYNKGIELVKEELSKEDSDIASVINYVQQTQPDLRGEKLLEEILTELTGREGAALIESGKKSGILDWIRSLFKEIGNMLGILDATPEQVANMTTREFAKSSAVQLLKGEDILAKAMNLRDSISYASMFGSVYSPVNDTVDSVAEELRACN